MWLPEERGTCPGAPGHIPACSPSANLGTASPQQTALPSCRTPPCSLTFYISITVPVESLNCAILEVGNDPRDHQGQPKHFQVGSGCGCLWLTLSLLQSSVLLPSQREQGGGKHPLQGALLLCLFCPSLLLMDPLVPCHLLRHLQALQPGVTGAGAAVPCPTGWGCEHPAALTLQKTPAPGPFPGLQSITFLHLPPRTAAQG